MLRRKKASENPEIIEAQKDRDKLLVELKEAVTKVDRLTDQLLGEYEAAETQRMKNGGVP